MIRRDLNCENMLQGSSEEREARKNLQKQLSEERRVSFGVGGMSPSLIFQYILKAGKSGSEIIWDPPQKDWKPDHVETLRKS